MTNTVTIAATNNSFVVDINETILNSATKQGINLPYGCGNGFCGACKAKLLTGQTEYPEDFTPQPLSDDEITAGMILCCKATIKNSIVLDVEEIINQTIKAEVHTTKILEINNLNNGVIILRLSLGEDNSLQFYSGQYVDFVLNNCTRSFSIASAPNTNILEFHIKHNQAGAFTNDLFNQNIKINDLLTIKAPFGTFFIREDSTRPVIFVATGTGFAPIKSMVENLLATQTNRRLKLYWGVRTEADLYLMELIRNWQQHDNFEFIPVLSKPTANWQGHTGYITQLVCKQNQDLAKYQIYLAGSPAMIEDAKNAFKKLGLPNENIFYDAFELGE